MSCTLRAELEHRHVGLVGDRQPVDRLDPRPEAHRRVEHPRREASIAIGAQVGDGGPGAGDRRCRASARGRRRRVQPARPRVVHEHLVPIEVVVAVEHERRALVGVPVLVDVGRHRGDALDVEAPGPDRLAELLPPRQQPSAEARVDVAARPAGRGQRGQLVDGIDDAERIAGSRTDDERAAFVDDRGHRVDVGTAVGAVRHADLLDVEVVARLGERRMRGVGTHEGGPVDAPCPGCLTSRLHCEEDALGAARRHRGAGGAEQVTSHRHDVRLHPEQGLVAKRVERVLVQELLGDLVLQRLELGVVHEVDEAEGAAAAPIEVAAAGGGQLVEDRPRCTALLGKPLDRCHTSRPDGRGCSASGSLRFFGFAPRLISSGGHSGSSWRRKRAQRSASSSSPIRSAVARRPSSARRNPGWSRAASGRSRCPRQPLWRSRSSPRW